MGAKVFELEVNLQRITRHWKDFGTFWIGRKTIRFESSLDIAPEIQELQVNITAKLKSKSKSDRGDAIIYQNQV